MDASMEEQILKRTKIPSLVVLFGEKMIIFTCPGFVPLQKHQEKNYPIGWSPIHMPSKSSR